MRSATSSHTMTSQQQQPSAGAPNVFASQHYPAGHAVVVHERDILLGGGAETTNHRGNHRLRQLIDSQKDLYRSIAAIYSPQARMIADQVLSQVMDTIRSEGARFLSKNHNHSWEVVAYNGLAKKVVRASLLGLIHLTEISDNDVKLGTGGGINNHAGNEKLRNLCSKNFDEYDKIPRGGGKKQKAAEIVQLFRSENPPGRFVKEIKEKGSPYVGLWREVEVVEIIDKVTKMFDYFRTKKRNKPRAPPPETPPQRNTLAAHGASEGLEGPACQQSHQSDRRRDTHGTGDRASAAPIDSSMLSANTGSSGLSQFSGLTDALSAMSAGDQPSEAFSRMIRLGESEASRRGHPRPVTHLSRNPTIPEDSASSFPADGAMTSEAASRVVDVSPESDMSTVSGLSTATISTVTSFSWANSHSQNVVPDSVMSEEVPDESMSIASVTADETDETPGRLAV